MRVIWKKDMFACTLLSTIEYGRNKVDKVYKCLKADKCGGINPVTDTAKVAWDTVNINLTTWMVWPINPLPPVIN